MTIGGACIVGGIVDAQGRGSIVGQGDTNLVPTVAERSAQKSLGSPPAPLFTPTGNSLPSQTPNNTLAIVPQPSIVKGSFKYDETENTWKLGHQNTMTLLLKVIVKVSVTEFVDDINKKVQKEYVKAIAEAVFVKCCGLDPHAALGGRDGRGGGLKVLVNNFIKASRTSLLYLQSALRRFRWVRDFSYVQISLPLSKVDWSCSMFQRSWPTP